MPAYEFDVKCIDETSSTICVCMIHDCIYKANNYNWSLLNFPMGPVNAVGQCVIDHAGFCYIACQSY